MGGWPYVIQMDSFLRRTAFLFKTTRFVHFYFLGGDGVLLGVQWKGGEVMELIPTKPQIITLAYTDGILQKKNLSIMLQYSLRESNRIRQIVHNRPNRVLILFPFANFPQAQYVKNYRRDQAYSNTSPLSLVLIP